MGFINQIHEPPFYFGVNRPEVERFIIPATWRENGVGLFGRANQDKPVAADSEVTIAHRLRQFRHVSQIDLLKAVHVDVIVAGPVHLGEAHRSNLVR